MQYKICLIFIIFLFREFEHIKQLIIDYEKIKENEEKFQKECEKKMEEFQQKIKYMIYDYIM